MRVAVVAVGAQQVTLGLHLGVEQVLDLGERGGVGAVVHQPGHAAPLTKEAPNYRRRTTTKVGISWSCARLFCVYLCFFTTKQLNHFYCLRKNRAH